MVASSLSVPNQSTGPQLAARAGAIAALVMLFAQLAWRLFGASAGVQSFPELIVAAIARLTPLNFFGYMTETFGSLAQNTLFVVVLLGIVVVGYEAGAIADRLFAMGRFGGYLRGRLLSGLVIAALLFLFTALVILPVAYLGLFARSSRNSTEILLQLGATFALYAIAWALITTWFAPDRPDDAPSVIAAEDRQHVGRRAVVGAGTLALAGGVGVLAWRVMQPQTVANEAASQQAAEEIAARAGGRVSTQPAATPAATEADQAATLEAATRNVAQVFEDLEAAGELTPRITSVADFYHVSKNLLDPNVDAEGWSLTIDGLVDTPLTFTYEELVDRATTQNITTLCCISNELNGDLVGTAEWTGIPLAELLSEAGVQAAAVDLKFSCADDYEDSIPAAVGQDPNVLVVVGMNGEPLAPDHGYPARLIVPPIYGMKNVKWVQRIEAVDHDFLGYWQTRGWDDAAIYQIWGRIDTPARADILPAGEPAIAAGMASAGDRGISRVELSLDEGETWADATLEPAINPPFTWVRWAFPFAVGPEPVELMMRATDGEGNVATSQRRPPLPAGATGWPNRTVRVEEA